MATTPEQEAAFTRLEGYNGNGYDPQANPLGFARGGNQAGVFVQSLRDVAIIGRLISFLFDPAVVQEIAETREEVADSRGVALAAAEAAAESAASVDGPAIASAIAAVAANAPRKAFDLNLHYGS